MTQYINKSAIMAEIEKRIADNKKDIERASHKNLEDYFEGYEDALVLFKQQYLDIIETKEVSYDEALERARKEYKNHEAFNGFREMLVRIFPELRENDNENDLEKEIIRVSKNEYFDFTDWKSIARHFYELGLKTQKKE